MIELDHIAVAGATLEEAVAHVEAALGVQMQPGGRHARFGTWNRLMGLADGIYLEAIAIDPEAPPPDRPRWFDLDRVSGAARLTTWICRTTDLAATLAALPVDAGAPVELTRGALNWRMGVPDDGVLPFDNRFPALIEWEGDLHPAAMLPASGCALRRLVVAHPCATELSESLAPLLNESRVVYEPGEPALMAEIDTPHGRRTLR